MMANISISAENLSKRFQRNLLFKNISFTCEIGESVSVTGSNGSGKSTLLQILALLKIPSRGNVEYSVAGVPVDRSLVHKKIGFCSPALNLYDELTAYENLSFASGISDKNILKQNLAEFQLAGHENKLVRYYSSGMKQRLKLLCALINKPPVIFLDEPGLALDSSGKEMIYSIINELKSSSIIILATNDAAESALCNKRIELGF